MKATEINNILLGSSPPATPPPGQKFKTTLHKEKGVLSSPSVNLILGKINLN